MRWVLLGVLAWTSVAGAVERPALAAGAWYPRDAATVRDTARRLVGPYEASAGGSVRALLVPHAAWGYSGATAGRAWRTVDPDRTRRVILVGPSHRVRFSGAALPAEDVTSFGFPGGDVVVDRVAVARLRLDGAFDGPAAAHDDEHALEVHLPMLALAAPRARVVPVLIGGDTGPDRIREVARALGRLVDDGTVVVASSDLTHHGTAYGWTPFASDTGLPDRMLSLGRATAGRIAALDATGFRLQVGAVGDTVCGRAAVDVLLTLLERSLDGAGEVLEVTTSGHASGRWDQVVTYAAVVVAGDWTGWRAGDDEAAGADPPTDAELDALAELARAALRARLSPDGGVAAWFEGRSRRAWWRDPSGVFVTLRQRDQRARERACVGEPRPLRPLLDAVVAAAVSAPDDPRADALDATELDGLEVEVAVLSPLRRVPSPGSIRLGVDGVVLTAGDRSGVFLPRVATETGWDRTTLVEQLARKAGLDAPESWRRGRLELFTVRSGSSRR